ncbi:CHAT domain-containing protein [Streptomyces sp. NPDC001920]
MTDPVRCPGGEAPGELPPPPPPGALELATALSFVTRIEPELIRAVRLRLLPHLDVGAEADLWFCEWVSARTPEAIALLPQCLPYLRAGLVGKLETNPRLREVADLVAEFHRELSPALFLEEQVTWHSLIGDTDTVGRHLDRVLHALVAENRIGLAGWFAEAWQRLPEQVRATSAAWSLANAARPYAPQLDPGTSPDLGLDAVTPIARAVGEARLGVLRQADGLLLGDVQGEGALAILVPDTRPRVVEVLADTRRQVVRIAGGAVVRVETGTGTVEVRTGTGDVYVIERARPEPATKEEGPKSEALYRLITEAGVRPDLGAEVAEELERLLSDFRHRDHFGALAEAIRLAEHALSSGYTPQKYPALGAAAALAQYLLGVHRGGRRPLERAIDLSSRVWSSAEGAVTARAWSVCGAAYRELFGYTGDIFDLDAALNALEPQLRRWPARGGDSEGLLRELLLTYVALHEADARGNHLAKAEKLAERAVRSEDLSVKLAAARVHLARYAMTGYARHVDWAEALGGRVQRNRGSLGAEQLAVMAAASLARFPAGEVLDRAVGQLRQGLRLVPASGRLQGARLQVELAGALRLRYRVRKHRADLDEALALVSDAVDGMPEQSVWRRSALTTLNRCLIDTYAADRRPADLERAIAAAREAAHAVRAHPGLPHTHLARAQLAESLTLKYQATGAVKHLNEAVTVLDPAQTASASVPPAVRVAHAVALASVLLQRHDRRTSRKDLRSALEVLDAVPEESSQTMLPPEEAVLIRARVIERLAVAGASVSAPVVRDVLAAQEELVRDIGVPPMGRLRSALLAGRVATRFDLLDEVVRSARAASRDLAPLLLLAGGELGDLVGEWEELSRDAAACAMELGEPWQALDILERRSALLSAGLGSFQAEAAQLAVTLPALTDDFQVWFALLGLETGAAESPVLVRRDVVAAEVNRMVGDLRVSPGFEPTMDSIRADEMAAAAAEGPLVVLNATARRCDALLVTQQGISTVPLPDLDAVTDLARRYRRSALDDHWSARHRFTETSALLHELWNMVVGPVLSALGLTSRPAPGAGPFLPEAVLPRIWWCPSGPFALLPLHAAEGPHGSAMDYAVHSYTPGALALTQARSPRHRSSDVRATPGLLALIASPSPSRVHAEEERAQRVLPHRIGRGAKRAISVLSGAERVDQAHLHYAGPGNAADKMSRRLRRDATPDVAHPVARGLAYLSAWDTAGPGTGRAEWAPSLGLSLHAAGYQHVIAVLGCVDDDAAVRIADLVYDVLVDSTGTLHPEGAARALHQALRRISETGSGYFLFSRAAMIHIGP